MSRGLVRLGYVRTGDEEGHFAAILGQVLEESPRGIMVEAHIAFRTNDPFLCEHKINEKICSAGVVPDNMPGFPWSIKTNAKFSLRRDEVEKMDIKDLTVMSSANISAAAMIGAAQLRKTGTGGCLITTYVGDVMMTKEAKGVEFKDMFDGPGLNPTPSCTAFAAELAMLF